MSRTPRRFSTSLPCFPRVSGDEPQYLWNLVDEYEFSPRERG